MIKKTEVVIKDLLERQRMLQKQLDAQIVMFDSQNQQISILNETVAFLEGSNEKLSEGIKQLVKENKTLDELCTKQQILLDEYSNILK